MTTFSYESEAYTPTAFSVYTDGIPVKPMTESTETFNVNAFINF